MKGLMFSIISYWHAKTVIISSDCQYFSDGVYLILELKCMLQLSLRPADQFNEITSSISKKEGDTDALCCFSPPSSSSSGTSHLSRAINKVNRVKRQVYIDSANQYLPCTQPWREGERKLIWGEKCHCCFSVCTICKHKHTIQNILNWIQFIESLIITLFI